VIPSACTLLDLCCENRVGAVECQLLVRRASNAKVSSNGGSIDCKRMVETHGIHLSSTNFLTRSRVLFALSLTLFSACTYSQTSEKVGQSRGVGTYDDGDLVRHDFCLNFSKIVIVIEFQKVE
jgi:hypothetical protein